jgi:hypothetical protein
MATTDASPTRLFVWFLGLLLVLAAVYVLWELTELRELVPQGVVIAAILLILGLAVMGIASQFDGRERATPFGGGSRTERRVTEEREYPDERERGPPPP